MKVAITGKNITVTDGMEESIIKQLGKCEKYLGPDSKVKVLIRTVKTDKIIEVTVPVSKGKVIRVEKRSDDFYEAVNLVEEVLTRKLRKEKEKKLDKKRMALKETLEAVLEPAIKRNKRFNIEMMTPDEAISEMESLDHDFHLFMNIEDGTVGVVYRRKDEGYGLLSANL